MKRTHYPAVLRNKCNVNRVSDSAVTASDSAVTAVSSSLVYFPFMFTTNIRGMPLPSQGYQRSREGVSTQGVPPTWQAWGLLNSSTECMNLPEICPK